MDSICFNLVGVEEHVIEIGDTEQVKVFFEAVVEVVLEGWRSIAYAEGRYGVCQVSVVCSEYWLPCFARRHSDLM